MPLFCGHEAVHPRWVSFTTGDVAEQRAARAMLVLHADAAHARSDAARAPWCNRCGLWMLRSLGRTNTKRPAVSRARLAQLAQHEDAEVARLKEDAAQVILDWADQNVDAQTPPPPPPPVARPPAPTPLAPVPADLRLRTGRYVSVTMANFPIAQQAKLVQLLAQELQLKSHDDEIEIDLGEVPDSTLYRLLTEVSRHAWSLRWSAERETGRLLVQQWGALVDWR
jgi:hypothetical protein